MPTEARVTTSPPFEGKILIGSLPAPSSENNSVNPIEYTYCVPENEVAIDVGNETS